MARPDESVGGIKILRRNAVVEKTGVSTRTILRWERLGLFPRRVRCGPNAVGYISSEIEEWLRTRPSAEKK